MMYKSPLKTAKKIISRKLIKHKKIHIRLYFPFTFIPNISRYRDYMAGFLSEKAEVIDDFTGPELQSINLTGPGASIMDYQWYPAV